ncbi:hypothetical protein [Leptospira idonii]|uniref:Uncharacterized protein n=1 Tax=Leptospira idonii TaxID=1193500 RepID=A0A4R9M0V5_9LEPT|nr:hypothetical protein [Leptospira idonii]TGN19435.1 hypothetical protein EHS15_08835 [Leptospira idonii]
MDTTWSGSAKKLLGNCLAVGVFVSEKGNEWGEEEKSETWAKVEEAMAWIVSQASGYNADVNFECLCLNPDSDTILADLSETGASSGSEEAAHQIAEQLEYKDASDMMEQLKEQYPSYQIHIIFLLNNESIAHHEDIHVGGEGQSIDVCLIHKENGIVLSATIAHESLHSFGAIDLYQKGDEEGDIKTAEYAYKKFPNDIMIECEDLEGSEISELTAFYLGWHGDPKPWYKKAVNPYYLTVLNFLMNNHQYYDEQGELVVSQEEELLRYSFEEGEFIRIKLNDDDNLVLWKQVPSGSEDAYEFWEVGTEGEFYVLEGKTDKYSMMEMPIDAGMSYVIDKFVEPETRDEWFEMTVVE